MKRKKNKSPQQLYQAARGNLLLMLIFSAVNVAFAAFGVDIYFLFSDYLAYMLALTGRVFLEYSDEGLYLAVGLAFAVLVLVPYLLLVMPLTGLISTVLCGGVRLVCMSEHPAVRILAGYGCTAVFLVAVMMGMQYAFVALYSMELDSYGYVTLFPTLAMAGAGQVGAGLALLVKARKTGNARFANVIGATIVPGMMGVGTPLLYGVTLPLGRPFVTACLGGGFGGAFIMACGVASSGWGASGLLGIPMMGAGPVGTKGMLLYCVGLAISCIMGFMLTFFTVPAERVKDV